MRGVVLAMAFCVLFMSRGSRGIKCFVGVQECHCGWNCTGIMSLDQVNAMNSASVNKTCQPALRLPRKFPVQECPRSDDVCLYVGNIQVAPYLDHNLIGRARIGNCFRKGVGSAANQSTYFPVFPQTDDSRKMQNWRFSMGGAVDVTKQGYLCTNVDPNLRWTKIPEYFVYCFCYRDLCNENLATVGAVKDIPSDGDVDPLILELAHNNTKEAKLIVYTVNTSTTPATGRNCGDTPDSEACEDTGKNARSAATRATRQSTFHYTNFPHAHAAVWLLAGIYSLGRNGRIPNISTFSTHSAQCTVRLSSKYPFRTSDCTACVQNAGYGAMRPFSPTLYVLQQFRLLIRVTNK